MDAVVHVFDPGEPGTTRDFTCSIHTLTHGMRYFKDVLQKSADSSVTPVEISVHCDVAIFEWLLGYCNGRITRGHITVEGVLPLLIASNFLQMDALVGDCLSFMATNLATVAQHQQQQQAGGGQSGDLTALPQELLSRLARVVSERKLEELASLPSADARARHMPLVNRLYKYRLEGCLRELKTTVARCSVCQGLFSLADRAKLECPGAPQLKGAADGPGSRLTSSQMQRRSPASSVHIPDAAWRLQEYLSSLRAQQIAWRGIYWHVWGLVHVLYCHTCMQHVPAANMRCCSFHPQPPVFAATAAAAADAAAAAARQPAAGFYPCCGAAASRGTDPRVAAASGCCAREHRLVSSGQAPGAPLPPGLTPELLSTLQHCTSLFTNPSALLVREPSGDVAAEARGGALGASAAGLVALAGDRHDVSASAVPAAGAAAAAAATAGPAVASKSPRGRQVSFLGNSSMSRISSGDLHGADADGRLVPPPVQAVLSSAAAAAKEATAAAAAGALPRRCDGNALGPATAATAAALGYCLSGMPGLDSETSGPGSPQLRSVPSGAQSPRAQPPGPASAANSPLQITGNQQVDMRRIAVAVARRLSRSGTGSSGGGGSGGDGSASEPAQKQPAPPQHHHQHHQHQQQRHALEHQAHYQHHLHSHQHNQHHQSQQRQKLQPHEQPRTSRELELQQQQHSRRPVLDTARSFTSLAALQIEAQEGAAAAASSRSPTTPTAVSARAVAGEDWKRPLPDPQPPHFGRPPATGAASLKIAVSPPPVQLAAGAGGGGGFSQTTHLERSRRHGTTSSRSPGHPGHQPQPALPLAPWPPHAGASTTTALGGAAASRSFPPGAPGGGTGTHPAGQIPALRSSSAELLALQLAAPPPSPSAARSSSRARASPDPRDASPPRSSAAAAGAVPRAPPQQHQQRMLSLPLPDNSAAAPAATPGTVVTVADRARPPELQGTQSPAPLPPPGLQRPQSPPSFKRPLSSQRHQQPHQQHHALRHSVQVHLQGGGREHVAVRVQAERSGAAPRRQALPPRPSGRAQGPQSVSAAAAGALQRRHSGGSWARPEYMSADTDSGDGYGEEDEGAGRSRHFVRKGSGAGSGSRSSRGTAKLELSRSLGASGGGNPPPGAAAAGGNGGGGGINPLQRSVQAVLLQQRWRLSQVQQQPQPGQQCHQQQHQLAQQQQQQQLQQEHYPPQPQQQHHHHHHHHQHQHQRQAHQQRPAGLARQAMCDGRGADVSRSWAPGEDAASASAAASAAAAAQERRALIEQYKTQKVLSPRPNNVHMIAIAELPSGSGGAGDGNGGGDVQLPQLTPRGAFALGYEGLPPAPGAAGRGEMAESSAAGSIGTRGSAGLTAAMRAAALPHDAAFATAEAAMVAAAATRPGGAGLFSAALDELDAPVLLPPPPPAMARSDDPRVGRGRKLRMELLYEDDNYRMDLLVKHLLACRPSHRAVVGARDQRALRGRSVFALAASSRIGHGAGRGTSGGRPASAAAALYGSRQVQPRSRSVSHLQRLGSAYMPGPPPPGTGQAYSAVGSGGGIRGGGGGTATPSDDGGGLPFDAQSGRPDGSFGGGGPAAGSYAGRGDHQRYSDADGGSWDKMGVGVLAGGGGFGAAAVAAARRSHDLRPLSAPRTWRYT